MARIRTIKPEFFYSETLAQVSMAAERTFCGLWTQADDEGYLKDVPAVLNGALWPLRPEHTAADMKADLDALIAVGVLCRFSVAGRSYLHLPTWLEHQKIARPTKSKHPKCEAHAGPVPVKAAAAEGQLPLDEGIGAPGKCVPQGQKEEAACGQVPGSAAPSPESVLHVTRSPHMVSGPETAPEAGPGAEGAETGPEAGAGGTFPQVSDLEEGSVLHVTRPPYATSGSEGADAVAEAAQKGGGGAPEVTFSQVSGLLGGPVLHVTRSHCFSVGERKGTGKGKERKPSTLRVLDARASDAHPTAPTQPACGAKSQPATASPPGPQDADTSVEQIDPHDADSITQAETTTSATSGTGETGEQAASAPAPSEEQQMVTPDENQGELFAVPEGAQAPAQPEKKKRAAGEHMTPDNKTTAKAILNPWWVMYGKGWGQSYGVVYSVLCSALKNGMSEEDIKNAMRILGPEKTPISGGTMQFALKKHAKSAEAAVAVQSARRDPSQFKHVL